MHNVEFRLSPTGILSFEIINETNPDIDELKIYFSHPRPVQASVWTLPEEKPLM